MKSQRVIFALAARLIRAADPPCTCTLSAVERFSLSVSVRASCVPWWFHFPRRTDCDEPSAPRLCPARNVSMARSRAVAKPGGEKQERALPRIHADTAAVLVSVRAFFSQEQSNRRAILRDRAAERTAEAKGFSFSVVAHRSSDGYRVDVPLDSTPETCDHPKWVPPGELVRMRVAIYAQYHNHSLPTLDSTVDFLNSGAKNRGEQCLFC